MESAHTQTHTTLINCTCILSHLPFKCMQYAAAAVWARIHLNSSIECETVFTAIDLTLSSPLLFALSPRNRLPTSLFRFLFWPSSTVRLFHLNVTYNSSHFQNVHTKERVTRIIFIFCILCQRAHTHFAGNSIFFCVRVCSSLIFLFFLRAD